LESFAPGVAEALAFYVYLLIDPADGSIFYVGKGTGNRCFQHLRMARLVPAAQADGFPKLAKIRAIEARPSQVRIDVLRHGMDEKTAFAVEQAAIDLVGGAELTNVVAGHDATALGHMSAADINAIYGASPVEIAPEHRCILIRINQLYKHGIDDKKLYEATRQWWRVGPWARNIGSPDSPAWAMAVYQGVVRAVYKIDSWEPAGREDIAQDHKRATRWRFTGARDKTLEQRYVNGSVTSYMPAAAQNPITYVPPRVCAEPRPRKVDEELSVSADPIRPRRLLPAGHHHRALCRVVLVVGVLVLLTAAILGVGGTFPTAMVLVRVSTAGPQLVRISLGSLVLVIACSAAAWILVLAGLYFANWRVRVPGLVLLLIGAFSERRVLPQVSIFGTTLGIVALAGILVLGALTVTVDFWVQRRAAKINLRTPGWTCAIAIAVILLVSTAYIGQATTPGTFTLGSVPEIEVMYIIILVLIPTYLLTASAPAIP
jgi:uncharacterized protein